MVSENVFVNIYLSLMTVKQTFIFIIKLDFYYDVLLKIEIDHW